ncbi:MAG: cell wall-binding repeat-containing protein, partial [Coriobacteriia bacterium]|nr:cell wall-binding repeat-containing protein [Coriobacteriia bacterium]
IIDVTTPTAPAVLGTCSTPSWANNVAISGTTAYVADSYGGLQVIDVAIPIAPVVLGTYDTPGSAYGIAISGTTAYVGDYGFGLQVIDVSTTPITPTLAGACDTPCSAYGVAISGTTAYVADGDSGLQIIDISNPTAPLWLGAYDTPGGAESVAVSGTTAYVADNASGLQIIDVSDSTAPTLRGTCDTPGWAFGVAVSGTTVYVADFLFGLQIIDVSDPTAPTLAGTYDTPGQARSVAVSGTTAYVADHASGLQIISTGLGYSWEVSDSPTTIPDAVIDGWSPAAQLSGVSDGTHYFHVRSVSGTRAYETQSYEFMIDTTAPTASDDAPAGVQSSEVTVTITAADAISGIEHIETRVTAPSATTTASAPGASTSIALTEKGDTTITYTAFDMAGNASATASVTVTLDLDVESQGVAGTNRYGTAIETSKRSFPEGADAVVIATGESWPDALGGSALAGVLDAPVLLTKSGALLADVAAEITRLGATEVYVLGGEQALCADVCAQLDVMLGADNVHRIGGATRYETAERIAARVVALQTSYDGTAFVATGSNFADALAASPLAAAKGWPVYLASQPALSSTTVAAMKAAGVTKVIVLGGVAAMPAGTSVTLLSVGLTAVRIDGADRYETAAKVADYGVGNAGLSWSSVALANGDGFADALCGGPAQGRAGSAMLLTRTSSLPTATSDVLTANKNAVRDVTFLGGLSAVSQSVRDQVMLLF